MRVFLLVLGIIVSSHLSWSGPVNLAALVEINGKKLYVEYTPAVGNKPTVVFVNGLTYGTKNWIGVTRNLTNEGYGVIVYDMAGMGTSLLNNPVPLKPILYSDQALDLRTLLISLKIKAPYNLVGLSYGGGIIASFAAQFPQDVGNLILLNPYTEFLETQRKWIKEQIANTRVLFPKNSATDEELTDYFIRQLVYSTYPMAEPSTLENPYKLEGVTRMVQGIRMYQPIEDTQFLPKRSLHLVVSEKDQYIPQDIYQNYWNAVPLASRASFTKVLYSEHKIPEAYPRFAFQFVKGVLDGRALLFNGDELLANPFTMEIKKK